MKVKQKCIQEIYDKIKSSGCLDADELIIVQRVLVLDDVVNTLTCDALALKTSKIQDTAKKNGFINEYGLEYLN